MSAFTFTITVHAADRDDAGKMLAALFTSGLVNGTLKNEETGEVCTFKLIRE